MRSCKRTRRELAEKEDLSAGVTSLVGHWDANKLRTGDKIDKSAIHCVETGPKDQRQVNQYDSAVIVAHAFKDIGKLKADRDGATVA